MKGARTIPIQRHNSWRSNYGAITRHSDLRSISFQSPKTTPLRMMPAVRVRPAAGEQ
jgi:hypothetical protein